MELITVIKVTPTSAKTASHIGAKPNTPKVKTTTFISNENTIFSFNIRIVFLLIFIISGSVLRLFEISIASAVLFAISVPSPIDILKSADAKTGLSFIPSPTNIVFPYLLEME